LGSSSKVIDTSALFSPRRNAVQSSPAPAADIALALDALEAMFDRRVDTFCLVTSDSNFAYLCRKLRERGAAVCIVGEPKTPDALRNASDQFYEWVRQVEPAPSEPQPNQPAVRPAIRVDPTVRRDDAKNEPAKLPIKRRPRFVIEAVTLLA
jgi:hypothetical protein